MFTYARPPSRAPTTTIVAIVVFLIHIVSRSLLFPVEIFMPSTNECIG